GQSGERAFEITATVDGGAQRNLDLLSLKPLVIGGFEQLAFDTRRADFERVPAAGHHLFDIQNGADLLGNQFAIGVSYALRLVDRDAHKTIVAAALDF